ncbi:MAG: ammonium transporter [Armatimonadetes bacterium]|nr:ammonium transporter [Armatimonadota bacterium]
MTRRNARAIGFLVALCAAPALADSATSTSANGADTAWVLACAALVLFMTPGLAMFYGGMVRRKNVLGTLLHSFIAIALISVLWVLGGFSLAFATGSPLIGGLQHVGLLGMTDAVWPNTTIPPLAFMIYQAMFAVITPALIAGAVAERMRLAAYLGFIALWSLLVYCPVAHWMWAADGWLLKKGALDFAGGNVVHVSSGFSALVACLVLGSRTQDVEDIAAPHNLTMTVLGAGILWFGWFGFNAGSALGANNIAATAFVNTNTAGASALLVWAIVEYMRHGHATVLGAVSGAVAGLAAVTPAAGFVSPLVAMLIGAVVAIVCFAAVELKGRFGYDDSLDAFGVHGIGGVCGMLATGVFALKAINPAGADGLLAGHADLLLTQIMAVAVVIVYSCAMTYLLLRVIGAMTPLTLTDEEQRDGMDLVLHNEVGYRM